MSSSVECLRGLIKQRLTAAAEDIFTVCLKTIVEYQKEIDHQRRLLEAVLTPGVKLHRIDLPQQHVCEEEEVLTDQEKNSSLDQEHRDPPQVREEQEELYTSLDQDDPDPPQIKEEQEELCISLEGEQLVLKQETDTFMLITTCETSDNSEDQTLDLKLDETQITAEKEIVIVSVEGSVEPEPNSDKQLLCHNSNVAESQDHKVEKHRDSGPTRNKKMKLKKRRHESKTHNKKEEKSATSKIHSDIFKCDTCGKTFGKKYSLHRHMRVHTEEKPYQCKTCEKRFSQLKTLIEHLRVHTAEKLYTCKTCGKRFSLLRSLDMHIKTHKGEKPYHCNTARKDSRNWTISKKKKVLKYKTGVSTGDNVINCNSQTYERDLDVDVNLRSTRQQDDAKLETSQKNSYR